MTNATQEWIEKMRHFAWELVTLGADYDLDSVEFVPIITQRRV